MSKFVLWVNNQEFYYDTYNEAYEASFQWHDKGFDDVTIEEVDDD
tara:strand:+ start:391 stop:525 length:135 start_codon:yes stop_codon:yes gene_type:complete